MSDPFVIHGNVLVRYLGSGPIAVIPPMVRKISARAFAGNRDLVRVDMPDSLIAIDFAAFMDCEKLASIHFSQSLREIGQSAFRNCRSLTTVELPDSIEILGGGLFFGCTSLQSLSLPASLPDQRNWLFAEHDALTEVTIRGASTPGTPAMLHRLMNNLVRCPHLTTLHVEDLSAVPEEWLPIAIVGSALDGLTPGSAREQLCLDYLSAHVRQMADKAASTPVLLDLMCRHRLIPVRLIDLYTAAVERTGSVQAMAILLAYRTIGPMARALAQAEARREQQINAVADRALARLGQAGIAGLTFATAGKIPAYPDFRDRTSLARWLDSHGARLADAITSRVDYVVADGELPPGKKAQAEALTIPVMTWKDLFDMCDAH